MHTRLRTALQQMQLIIWTRSSFVDAKWWTTPRTLVADVKSKPLNPVTEAAEAHLLLLPTTWCEP